MEFEWDEAKNRTNLEKHGLRFDDAAAVFDDPLRLTEPGNVVEEEIRFQVIGKAGPSAILFVAYTLRTFDDAATVIRLISARRASRLERQRYDLARENRPT